MNASSSGAGSSSGANQRSSVDVVPARSSPPAGRASQVSDSTLRSSVRLHPDAEELDRLDLEAGLLAQLAAERVERVLVLLEEAAGNVPAGRARVVAAASEQHAAVALDERCAPGTEFA